MTMLNWANRISLAVLLHAFVGVIAAQPALQITAPADGAVVQPGATVTIVISGSGTTFANVFVLGEDPIGDCEAVGGPSFQCIIQIPSEADLGT